MGQQIARKDLGLIACSGLGINFVGQGQNRLVNYPSSGKGKKHLNYNGISSQPPAKAARPSIKAAKEKKKPDKYGCKSAKSGSDLDTRVKRLKHHEESKAIPVISSDYTRRDNGVKKK